MYGKRGDWATRIPSRKNGAVAPRKPLKQHLAPQVTFSKKKKPKYSKAAIGRRLGAR